SGVVERVGNAAPTPVAVLATHDGPLVAAILGVITSGHIVVVVDPTLPAEQSAAMLASVGSPLILHDEAFGSLARSLVVDGALSAALVAIDDLTGGPREYLPADPAAPLMLAFTSGTSGEPKAAIITHGVLMNLVRGATNALGIGPDDRMPMLFPVSLAVAAYPMFLPLLNGGTLATLDVRSVGLAPIGEFLETERITLAYMAPTVIRFLVDSLGDRTFPDMRMVALGGELVDNEVLDLTVSMFHPDHVAVGYGTTETGVTSLWVVDAGTTVEGTAPCGFAVPDVELALLDTDGRPVPAGESGEVAIVSRYMFEGYWGHPELNRQVLASDPAGRSDVRMYRTGDHARFDESGALVVLGRVDTNVKIRGRFVVLGDVEADLHEIDAVTDAAVMARSVGGVNELVAYVVAAGDDVDPTELRAALLERREAFRVPSRWVMLDELPRLPNGKLDRRALPDPLSVSGVPDTGRMAIHGADHDDVRRTIRDLWERLLPIGAIGLDEDFMLLGGDSLLAAQMLVQVEHELGVTIPMGELVHARTVRELSEVVVRLRSDAGAPSTVACVQAGDASRRPRLWFVHDLQGSAYRVRHLAAALGDDQPVWSFESPLLHGDPNPFTSLDTFAARYVTDLLEAQPDGPYLLAGYSFGGITAYEMARQLDRDGYEVGWLGVVDVGPGYRGPGYHGNRSPFRPWFGVAPPPPPGTSASESLRYYRNMVTASPSGALRHLMVRSGVSRLVDPVRWKRELAQKGRVRPEWRLWYAWEEHWRLAAKAWDRTTRWAGRMDLFWASDTPSADATMGWGSLVDDLRIHRFAGDHMGVLEPAGAPLLGSSIRAVLDEMQFVVDAADTNGAS
ncbi:MAG: AMP-binding protein, partial [Actinomycetes bacterium]